MAVCVSRLLDGEGPAWATALFNGLPKLEKLGGTLPLPDEIMEQIEKKIGESELRLKGREAQ